MHESPVFVQRLARLRVPPASWCLIWVDPNRLSGRFGLSGPAGVGWGGAGGPGRGQLGQQERGQGLLLGNTSPSNRHRGRFGDGIGRNRPGLAFELVFPVGPEPLAVRRVFQMLEGGGVLEAGDELGPVGIVARNA